MQKTKEPKSAQIEVMGQKLYNNKETASLLGVSLATLAKLRKEHKIQSVRYRKELYTSEKVILAYINGETALDLLINGLDK